MKNMFLQNECGYDSLYSDDMPWLSQKTTPVHEHLDGLIFPGESGICLPQATDLRGSVAEME